MFFRALDGPLVLAARAGRLALPAEAVGFGCRGGLDQTRDPVGLGRQPVVARPGALALPEDGGKDEFDAVVGVVEDERPGRQDELGVGKPGVGVLDPDLVEPEVVDGVV